MSAFAVTGFEYYQRFAVPVSQDPVDVANLGSKPDTSYITDTVFLRIETKGKNATLYSYTDNLKPRYYILETGETQPQELAFHAYYGSAQDGSTTVQYIRRFRAQLEYLAQKYGVAAGSAGELILHADYREPELIKIVQLINGSSGGGFTPRSLSGIRYFAGAGLYFNTIEFSGNTSFPARSIISPKISAGIDLLPNKNVQKLFLRAEVTLSAGSYDLSNSTGPDGDVSTLDFKQYNLSVAPQIFYNFYNSAALKVFLSAGVSFNYSFYNNYSLIENFQGISTISFNKFPTLAKSWASFPIKAGVLLNRKLEIYAGFAPKTNISDALSSYASVGSVVSYQAGVNYLFGGR